MLMGEEILTFLGLCRKSGRMVLGMDPVGEAVRTGRAKLIITAGDAGGNTLKKARHMAGQIPLGHIVLPFGKDVLGRSLGFKSCSIIAVLDEGFAAGLIKKSTEEEV